MTEQQRQRVQTLIPDLLPLDHISFNTKRIRFIQGQGVVLYDDIFAVEIYVPRQADETMVFFGIQRHHDNIAELREYFRKPKVQHYNSAQTTDAMKRQFEEAVFQYQPSEAFESPRIISTIGSGKKKDTHSHIHVYMHENLSGAA